MLEPAAFLIQPAREGYPTDYLLARIRRRRREFLTDWSAGSRETVVAELHAVSSRGLSPQQARSRMHQEFRWVYLQMNRRMRETFAPLFLWFEIRTITICLRLLRSGEKEQVAVQLAESLLGQRLRSIFTQGASPFAVKGALAGLVEADARQVRQLDAWYREGKGSEYEQRIVSLYLERVTGGRLHPALEVFFRSLVDLNNLVPLAKQMRWRLPYPPVLIPGGTIGRGRLEKVFKEGDESAIVRVLREEPDPGAPEALPGNLEHYLLCRLTRKVRKLAVDPLGAGLILAYLWECYLEARNSALVQHSALFGEEALAAELIR